MARLLFTLLAALALVIPAWADTIDFGTRTEGLGDFSGSLTWEGGLLSLRLRADAGPGSLNAFGLSRRVSLEFPDTPAFGLLEDFQGEPTRAGSDALDTPRFPFLQPAGLRARQAE